MLARAVRLLPGWVIAGAPVRAPRRRARRGRLRFSPAGALAGAAAAAGGAALLAAGFGDKIKPAKKAKKAPAKSASKKRR